MKMLELLKESIENKNTIEFKYLKSGKVDGVRIGNPHAIYFHPTTNNPTVDVYQIDGDSDSSQAISGWRPFLLEYIKEISISNMNFDIAEGYDSNPKSGKYSKIISKVK